MRATDNVCYLNYKEYVDTLEKGREKRIKPNIVKKALKDIDVNDPFFDSLKTDYPDYTKWFSKKKKQGANAYVTVNKRHITSLLMIKVENEEEDYGNFSKEMKKCRRLKIETFKVEDTGKHIANTFIEIIKKKAIELKIEEIYITILDKHKELINFLIKEGFYYYCIRNTNEKVYIKEIRN